MITNKEEVYDLLHRLDIDFTISEHHPVDTIDEMKKLSMKHIDHVAKNLFVRDGKKNYYLIIVRQDKRVDLKKLRDTIHSSRLSFASEDDLYSLLGLKKGSVTVTGLLNDSEGKVNVVVDKDLWSLEFIGVHPNFNDATIWISIDDLIKICRYHQNTVLVETL